MRKTILARLGKLLALEESLWDQLAEQPRSKELRQTYRLIRVVKKNLEEQQRGFLKSKVPYLKMADTILGLAETVNYETLHKEVMRIALSKPSPRSPLAK